ncbi:MAG: hypothetical protein ACO3RG_00960, partial [Nitriliruptoraceae bacterium]
PARRRGGGGGSAAGGGRGGSRPAGDGLAPLRRELAKVEAELAAAESEVAELTRRLADPDLYADPDAVAVAVAAHGVAKDAAAGLMRRWEELGTALETAEAETASAVDAAPSGPAVSRRSGR